MSFALGLVFAVAAPFADLDTIDRTVAAFTGVAIGQPGGAVTPVDRRLRLRACAAPLGLSWRTPRRESVVVQCQDAGGWRIFVPVQAVPVVFQLAAAAPAALPAVNRGDAVTIAVSGNGFTVSQPGEAMEAGPVGAWIRVRPARATRAGTEPMRARIVRPGVVELPLP
ncbi:MAG TPA: flagella basal body P-ring formation protein FlgA [Novosphingobium sp.]|nr:flagella basal body P-ring formation protein FlgA [Novosphingobium sp.]